MFADLTGRRCLVVGGGAVAERKAFALLRCGAHLTIASPVLTRRLTQAVRRRRIRHIARSFQATDVRGMWLVCAATNDPQVNGRVFRTATQYRIFTNVVDQPLLCSFIAPAILRRGPLTIAISTGGASPSLAKRIRRDMERMVGDGYVPMLRLLASLRGEAKRTLSTATARRRYFDRVISGRVFELVRAGKQPEARRAATRLLDRSARRR
jgi:uroporphyrin-III C-methyltransferase/precorrin-2 dehydrogenase/sirohydrochlorin ferrochelatase